MALSDVLSVEQKQKIETKKVAVLGFGNIGAGIVDILRRGVPGLELSKIVVKDIGKKRSTVVPANYLTTDVKGVINNPKIDIIVELMGGIEPAKTYLMNALRNGKDVVTANKKLIAEEGYEIFRLASSLGRHVGFRGTFVGCHSLIYDLSQEGATTKDIRKIYAILNGTCNYILSTMAKERKSFKDAVREAQEKGYAESDPSEDIDGTDTAYKVRILLSLMNNSYNVPTDFPVQGIANITEQDMQYASALGYSIKLLGVIERMEEGFSVGVYPAMLLKNSLLGSIEGPFNGIRIEDKHGMASGLVALGAGRYPTANAILVDLKEIAANRNWLMPNTDNPIVLNSEEHDNRRYYLGFSVVEQPGVLAKICGILGNHGISIASVIQKESISEEFVPVVMTTHLAKERDLRTAVEKKIDNLDIVRAKTKIIPIFDFEL
jgi:homoserine dehydrogenase